MIERIARLRERSVYLGTSSWKYEGWKGLIYRRPYRTKKEFEETCLGEYAEHYPAVGVDHTYYAWPLPTTFDKYVQLTPAAFRFGLKVTEKITIRQYPNLKRYGKEAGTTNADFLSAALFEKEFIEPIAKHRERLGPLMLEFSQFHPGMIGSGREFTERLDRFFTDLAHLKGYQLAVEMRNAGWLKPPYFEMLAKHNVAHVFNSWTRMPTIAEQLALTRTFKPPMIVARLLLQPGTKYEEAVEAFSPYNEIRDPQPELRTSGAALIERAIELGVPAFVFVNNRAEGCAPMTIEGILAALPKLESSPT